MKCLICKKKDAVVHYAEIINGKMKKMDLCEDCAMQKGVGVNLSFSVGDLLAGLTENEPVLEKSKEVSSPKTCKDCKLTYVQFKNTGRLGCSTCYETFEKNIKPIFETVQKGLYHIGKVPSKAAHSVDIKERIAYLEEKLEAAITNEEYEEAASLRDEIRILHRGVGFEVKEKKKTRTKKTKKSGESGKADIQ